MSRLLRCSANSRLVGASVFSQFEHGLVGLQSVPRAHRLIVGYEADEGEVSFVSEVTHETCSTVRKGVRQCTLQLLFVVGKAVL